MAGCLHRCAFCNQAALHPGALGLPSPDAIEKAADLYFGARSLSPSSQHVREIAFYGGNFSGLPEGDKARLLGNAAALRYTHGATGVRASTRPDHLTAVEAAFLAARGVTFVELGAQSFDDTVLEAANRGHTAADVERAVHHLKAAGIGMSIHLMCGLPGASFESDLLSARRAAGLNPDAVRIHPTLVLRGSALEREWHAGAYTPLTLDEAVARCAAMIGVFEAARIPVIRVGLHGDDALAAALCAGPFHPNLRDLVESERGRSQAPPGRKGMYDRGCLAGRNGTLEWKYFLGAQKWRQ